MTYFNDMEAIFEAPGSDPALRQTSATSFDFRYRICRLCGSLVHHARGEVHYDWHRADNNYSVNLTEGAGNGPASAS